MPRQFKVRKPSGQVEYVDCINTHEVILLLRCMSQDGILKPEGREILNWVNSLGHEPSAAEFMGHLTRLSVRFVDVGGEIESHEN